MSQVRYSLNKSSSEALMKAVKEYFQDFPSEKYNTVVNFHTNPPVFKATIVRNENPRP